MADIVKILDIDFEVGEILTADKMNKLANNVEAVLAAINDEKERAQQEEDSIKTQIFQINQKIIDSVFTLNKAIEREANTRTSQINEIKNTMPSINTERDTLEVNSVQYLLTRSSEAFFKGEIFDNTINTILGLDNIGIYTVKPASNLGIAGYIDYYNFLLVTADTKGNTYQFMFRGFAPSLLIDSNVGSGISMRYHNGTEWSGWKNVLGEKVTKDSELITTQGAKMVQQQAEINSIKVNQEIAKPMA